MSFIQDPGQGTSIDPGIFSSNAGDMFKSGGGLSMDAINNAKSATQQLVNAANSGGFKISEEGVKPMRKALTEMQERLNELRSDTLNLTVAPQLGSHPYGHTVAAHDQKGAADEAGSAMVILEQLGETLKQADEALARAAGIYKEGENQAVDAATIVQA